jgi:hypothetical protein
MDGVVMQASANLHIMNDQAVWETSTGSELILGR